MEDFFIRAKTNQSPKFMPENKVIVKAKQCCICRIGKLSIKLFSIKLKTCYIGAKLMFATNFNNANQKHIIIQKSLCMMFFKTERQKST